MKTLIAMTLAALVTPASGQTCERPPVRHAVPFGSYTLRSTLPRAYVRVTTSPHAVRFGSEPIRATLPPLIHRQNSSGHAIRFAARPVQGTTPTPRAQPKPPAEERRSTIRRVERPQRAEPVPPPSRHALRVWALMQNRLECHP